ncbi:hypothetical protein BWQ96_02289 [Gracilariopsis chorda]|uniref:Uncharacterized protein n=1 Tax=Gracilariopsis chorda TaxID=448386 RepID=A0A2V3J0R7_9FLOR|nr:hypothetical protein BWQ96_02289 [Gracilariopsis chorda]|eukprot:PXF47903.1 hypothetical protein BWQ96_02289 [Gracilariopsis chorda]
MADGSIRESIGGEHDTFVSIDVYQQSNVDTASALNEDTEVDLHTVVEDDWNAAEYEAAADQGFESEQPLENDMAAFMWNLSSNPDSVATAEEEVNSDETQEMPMNEYGLTHGYSVDYGHSETSSQARTSAHNSSHVTPTNRFNSSTSHGQNHSTDRGSHSNGHWPVAGITVPGKNECHQSEHLLGISRAEQDMLHSATPTIHASAERNRSSHPRSSLRNSANRIETSIPDTGSEICADEERKRELDLASRGVTSYELANPFKSDDEEDATTVILLSRSGDMTSRERRAIRLMSATPHTPEARVMKRLFETITFLYMQLRVAKEAEVQLADEMLETERRRFSAADLERSHAFNTLIEEIDKERKYSTELEKENEKLVEELKKLRSEQREVHLFFSNYDPNFDFSRGVSEALSSAVGNISEFREQYDEKVQDYEQRLASSVERLTKTEGFLAENRKLYDEAVKENERLRQLNANDALRSGTPSPKDSPSRRASMPPDKFEKERIELLRKVEEQEYQLGDLRAAQRELRNERDRKNKAMLRLNVEIQELHKTKREVELQRDEAQRKQRELRDASKADKENFRKCSAEMTENLQEAVQEISLRESQIQQLRSQLEERSTAYDLLSSTSRELENVLQKAMGDIVGRSKDTESRSESGPERHALVEEITASIRNELSRAQTLLVERGTEADKLRKELHGKNLALSNLRAECARLQSASYIKRRSSTSNRLTNDFQNDEQQAFLQRLSDRLGCKSGHQNEVVEQLSNRIEVLLTRSQTSEEACEELRKEIEKRENALSKIKAELQADIATLKAENASLENAKHIADEERMVFEQKYAELLGQRDVSRDSFGDLTASSYGGYSSRRQSIFSNLDVDVGVSRWNDPLVEAAICSLDSLIGRKEEFAARYRLLREKLEGLVCNMVSTEETSNEYKTVLIESIGFQEELTGVVSAQREIIAKLRSESGAQGLDELSNAAKCHTGETTEHSLPYISEVRVDDAHSLDGSNAKRASTTEGRLSLLVNSMRENSARHPVQSKETNGFLKTQFQHICGLYEEKLRANAELCGIVQAQKVELDAAKSTQHDLEFTLSEQRDTYDTFIARLSALAGCEKSSVAVEDSVNSFVREYTRLNGDLSVKEIEQVHMCRRIANLITQKAVLSKLVDIYQSKYKLDVLATTPAERSDPSRRLRIMVKAVVIAKRLMNSTSPDPDQAQPQVNVSEFYSVTRIPAIGRRRSSSMALMDASVAVSAIPKLEQAIMERDEQISQLKGSITALNKSSSVLNEVTRSTRKDPPSFSYNEDIVNRKNDLSRKLRDVIAEREELEKRLSREKQSRVAAEARVVKYVDRVSAMKKKLQKVHSHAESKERTYKAAIRHLKEKADTATNMEVPGDENVDPLGERQLGDGNGRITIPRNVLESYISRAEGEMSSVVPGSGPHEELLYYIGQMRMVMRRVEKERASLEPTAPLVN